VKITERLAAEGFYVYAGARHRTTADLADLDAIENVGLVELRRHQAGRDRRGEVLPRPSKSSAAGSMRSSTMQVSQIAGR
jgi:hypothetical protein